MDKLEPHHLLFALVIVVALLVIGQTTGLLARFMPPKTTIGGQTSPHYVDGIIRYPTTPEQNSTFEDVPYLWYSRPYVVPGYQERRMNSDYGAWQLGT